MKKFVFQLAALLKVTKMRKEQAEVKFAEATQFTNLQKKMMCQFQAELQQGLNDYYHLAMEKVTVDRLISYSSYFDRMKKQIEQQREIVREAEKKQAECLDLLRIAMNKLKSIEQLKEKRFAEFREEQLFEEQKELDEIGLQVYTRMVR